MMKIELYALNGHPDISAFYDDYGVDTPEDFAEAFGKLARDIAGYKVVTRLTGSPESPEYELDVWCQDGDIKALEAVLKEFVSEF